MGTGLGMEEETKDGMGVRRGLGPGVHGGVVVE